jgi:hypothetical protein
MSKLAPNDSTTEVPARYRRKRNDPPPRVRSAAPVDYALFVSGEIYTFGTEGPRFTISGTRREATPPLPTPGPAHYYVTNPMHAIVPRRIGASLRQEADNSTITSGVDFYAKPTFAEGRQTTIGRRWKSALATGQTVSPGPNYVPPTSPDLKHSHAIISRHDVSHADDNPPPGTYSPRLPYLTRAPSYTLTGPIHGADWVTGGADSTPGPGEYTPADGTTRRIGVTLAGHARNSRPVARSVFEPKGENLVAIGQLVVRLRKGEDPEEARRYIFTHNGLRKLIIQMVDTVLEEKPDDPVAFLRAKYQEMKEEMEAQNPHPVEADKKDDDDTLKWE